MIKFAIAIDRLKIDFVDIIKFVDIFDKIVFNIIVVIDKFDFDNFDNFDIDYEDFNNQQKYIAIENRIERSVDNYRLDSRRWTYNRKHDYDILCYY